MDIEALRVGDYMWHGPTEKLGGSGTVESIEDFEGGHFLIQLNNGSAPFIVTRDGFRMWWNVERHEDQIHYQTHKIGANGMPEPTNEGAPL